MSAVGCHQCALGMYSRRPPGGLHLGPLLGHLSTAFPGPGPKHPALGYLLPQGEYSFPVTAAVTNHHRGSGRSHTDVICTVLGSEIGSGALWAKTEASARLPSAPYPGPLGPGSTLLRAELSSPLHTSQACSRLFTQQTPAEWLLDRRGCLGNRHAARGLCAPGTRSDVRARPRQTSFECVTSCD